jgi:hypothetical protein
MRISLERTGGFAGIKKTTIADTELLSPSEVQQLHQLVQTADFFSLPTNISSSNQMSDRFSYKLTLQDSDRQHTVTASESVLPEILKPLIEWLATK